MSLFSVRTLVPALVAAGLIVSIPLISLVTAPAAAAADASPLVAGSGSVTEPVDEVATEAQHALNDATDALLGAVSVRAQAQSSGLDLAAEITIDTATLRGLINALERADVTPTMLVGELTDQTVLETEQVRAQATSLRTDLDEARATATAVSAAQQAVETVAATADRAVGEAEARAEALAAANTVAGAKATAASLASTEYGWGSGQFSCLESLWNRESSWDYTAYNASSGATGIPQALPGSKMATFGSDWQTSATTQVQWGLDYISRAYGSPCSAWAHSQSTGWY